MMLQVSRRDFRTLTECIRWKTQAFCSCVCVVGSKTKMFGFFAEHRSTCVANIASVYDTRTSKCMNISTINHLVCKLVNLICYLFRGLFVASSVAVQRPIPYRDFDSCVCIIFDRLKPVVERSKHQDMQMQMYYIYMYTGPVITNQVMSPNKM